MIAFIQDHNNDNIHFIQDHNNDNIHSGSLHCNFIDRFQKLLSLLRQLDLPSFIFLDYREIGEGDYAEGVIFLDY
jgi:hypothetical protein